MTKQGDGSNPKPCARHCFLAQRCHHSIPYILAPFAIASTPNPQTHPTHHATKAHKAKQDIPREWNESAIVRWCPPTGLPPHRSSSDRR